MKKQIVVIHGGRTFPSYQEYIDSLKNRQVTAEKFKRFGDWRFNLHLQLPEEFEVFAPKMPNGQNAVYDEWCIWFERLTPFLQDNVVLIGHSLGGIFLAKYLSENEFSKKIKSLILVAAPFNQEGLEESLGNFVLPASLEKVKQQVEKIYVIQSKDDPVVPFSQAQKYLDALPQSQLVAFEDRGHFNQESFPELIDILLKIG